MKTPYDSAMRIQQREIDDVRVSINIQVNQLVQVESSLDAAERAVAREGASAAQDPMMSSYAYITRMRAERARLDADRKAAGQQLDRLRVQAANAYGSLSAMETAADRHRADQIRTAESAEQSRIDDFAAIGFLRARRARTSWSGKKGRSG